MSDERGFQGRMWGAHPLRPVIEAVQVAMRSMTIAHQEICKVATPDDPVGGTALSLGVERARVAELQRKLDDCNVELHRARFDGRQWQTKWERADLEIQALQGELRKRKRGRKK